MQILMVGFFIDFSAQEKFFDNCWVAVTYQPCLIVNSDTVMLVWSAHHLTKAQTLSKCIK